MNRARAIRDAIDLAQAHEMSRPRDPQTGPSVQGGHDGAACRGLYFDAAFLTC
jgi:hypothetical protein